ncbi:MULTISPECIES: tRNA(Met) cytidine acetyltransferase TmcA [Halorussus]|uniref:tRNA(Met) cytidine acetyltransferase TmcA n=1 Tax=Halorussus TaxID=1070314 RepID=UPI00209E2F18|nr:tRNA(Met) cytidine acetyltransferase TmcA [Halorussus vallis]USZ76338.1 GNAT family N-acetyltransferase [Halorussus vallis]
MTTRSLARVASALREEARAANERRLLVLAGERDACYGAADAALDAAEIDREATTLVGTGRLGCERVGPKHAAELLGTTRECVVLDAHADFRPNAVGRVVGAVDGGGLFVLLVPSLAEFPERRTAFDRTLAVPPADLDDVTGRFRARFVETLREHPGVAIAEVRPSGDTDEFTARIERDGLTHPAPRLATEPPESPADHGFPDAAYDACLTADQMSVVRALEALRASDERGTDEKRAVVAEADRGRGKSSAAGIAAGALTAEGADVLVTAPEYRSAREVFVRAAALLESLGREFETDRDPPREIRVSGPRRNDADSAARGGRIRYAKPTAAAEAVDGSVAASANASTGVGDASSPDAPDVVLVDEAAALSVGLLERFLAADRVAFATTVHGYEGAGRGFSVRFRDRLAESGHEVTETRLDEPIRYAAGDPVEVWAFRALLLDARPPVEAAIRDADPETATYRALSPEALLADETRLREAFGLLVLAHYRTEPDDLARLLDAPNLEVRALVDDGGDGDSPDSGGHVVAVALLAHEGNLSEELRRETYDGGRIRGNMLPDVLVSQLRDEAAGVPAGLRVMRIAVHHAVRSRGLGSRLLAEIRAEFEDDLDWLGTGFGATPDLLRFWHRNGYRSVQLSTTRNEASGEYSALMLDPLSEAGRDLRERHAEWFASRVVSMLTDPLDDANPDVVRALLRTVDAPVALDLSAWDWRAVAASAYGPGLFDATPRPFRRVVLKHFVDPVGSAESEETPASESEETPVAESDAAASDSAAATDPRDALSAREERLLVRKVLQAREWREVADELGFHSPGQCMRALGDALKPLVDRYGDEAAAAEKRRYE